MQVLAANERVSRFGIRMLQGVCRTTFCRVSSSKLGKPVSIEADETAGEVRVKPAG